MHAIGDAIEKKSVEGVCRAGTADLAMLRAHVPTRNFPHDRSRRHRPPASPITAIAIFALYLRRSFAKSMGYSSAMLAKPVVGIANTASGFNNCHRHLPELGRRGEARRFSPPAGLPIEFPDDLVGRGSSSTRPASSSATSCRWTPRR